MTVGAVSPTMRLDRPTLAQVVGTAVAIQGMTVSELGVGPLRITEFVFEACELTIPNADAFLGTKIYDFPTGVIHVLDAVGALTLTTTSVIADTLNSGVTVNWGLGSATASNVTLATTMIDMLPGSGGTLPAFTSSTVINVASAKDVDYLKHATAQNAAAIFDGSGTAIDMYFNLAVPTNTDIDADATVEVDGVIYVYWMLLHNGELTI